jgi:acid phosphatase (class A)
MSLYLSFVHETASDVGRSIGYWAGPQQLPVTDKFFSNLSKDVDFFLWSLKFSYNRPRPFMLEPKIHDLEESKAASYPGGHATHAYTRAFILQELAPEFGEFFIKKAYDVAHARELMGVHFPSDSEVSRALARQLVTNSFRTRNLSAISKV